MTAPTPHPQQRGSFAVSQRLLRGYGPLAVLAGMLLLMSVLVPSKVQDTANLTTSGSGFTTGSGSSTGSGSGTEGPETVETVPGGGEAAAAGGAAGGEGGEGGQAAGPGATGGCPDRQEQVPGDPYSPPCIAFSGANGGATSKGVSDTTIKVAYRVLNEKGFQQTLAQLAGASLSDSPDAVVRTVQALADYFNERFQFYGRKIEIVPYDGKGSNTNELLGKGREQAVADAIKVADEIGAFADLSATSEPYAGALADRGPGASPRTGRACRSSPLSSRPRSSTTATPTTPAAA